MFAQITLLKYPALTVVIRQCYDIAWPVLYSIPVISVCTVALNHMMPNLTSGTENFT